MVKAMDMILDAHCPGKQKYEQLVEIKLSLEMEIQTYRSILEDEEKRIRRCFPLMFHSPSKLELFIWQAIFEF